MAPRSCWSSGGTHHARVVLATVLILVLVAETRGRSQLAIVQDIGTSLENILLDIQSLGEFLTTTAAYSTTSETSNATDTSDGSEMTSSLLSSTDGVITTETDTTNVPAASSTTLEASTTTTTNTASITTTTTTSTTPTTTISTTTPISSSTTTTTTTSPISSSITTATIEETTSPIITNTGPSGPFHLGNSPWDKLIDMANDTSTESSAVSDLSRLEAALDDVNLVVQEVSEGTITESQVDRMQFAEFEVKDVTESPDQNLLDTLRDEPDLLSAAIEDIEDDQAIISSIEDDLKKKQTTSIIVGSVLGGLLLIILVAVGAVYWQRNKKKKRRSGGKVPSENLPQSSTGGEQQMIELSAESDREDTDYLRPVIGPAVLESRTSADDLSRSSTSRRNEQAETTPSDQSNEASAPGPENTGFTADHSPRPIVPPKPWNYRANFDPSDTSPGPMTGDGGSNWAATEPTEQRVETEFVAGRDNPGYVEELPLSVIEPPQPWNDYENNDHFNTSSGAKSREHGPRRTDFGPSEHAHYIDELNSQLVPRGEAVRPVGGNYYHGPEPKRRSHRDRSPRHHHREHRSRHRHAHHVRRTPSVPPPDYTIPRHQRPSGYDGSRERNYRKTQPYMDFEPPQGPVPPPQRPERDRRDIRRPYGPEDIY